MREREREREKEMACAAGGRFGANSHTQTHAHTHLLSCKYKPIGTRNRFYVKSTNAFNMILIFSCTVDDRGCKGQGKKACKKSYTMTKNRRGSSDESCANR